MKKSIQNISGLIKIEIFIALAIFGIIQFTNITLFKAIAFMLGFIVVLEVVRMVGDFIMKGTQAIKIRYVIDGFIIFLLRDVIIVISDEKIIDKEFKVGFLLAVIFTFFIFRIFSLKYSPSDKNCEDCIATIDNKCELKK